MGEQQTPKRPLPAGFRVVEGGLVGDAPRSAPPVADRRETPLTGPVIDYLRRNPEGVRATTVIRLCDTADHHRRAVLEAETRERRLRDLLQGVLDGEITVERAAAALQRL